jgi:CysZ protein
MIINLIIYGSIFILSYIWLFGSIGIWLGTDEAGTTFWLEILHVLLLILGFLLVLIVCYFLFTIFGGIITAPFNENISQIVEEGVTGTIAAADPGFWKDAVLSIKSEIQKLAFYFSILFLIFLLNILPVVGNILSLILGTVFSFYFNALDFLDYPMQRKLMKFKNKLKVTQNGGMISYGFGAMAFLMMFLPIVNVFMKPILVVAGTRLYWEKNIYSSYSAAAD